MTGSASTRAAFAAALLLAACSSDRALSGEEIRALFSGRTVEGYHEVQEYEFRSYYDPGGTFRSYRDGGDRARHASWWVSGGLMCIRWRDRSRDLCRAIEVDGDGRYRKITEDRGGDRKVVVTYRRFTDDNPAGL